LGIQGYDIQYKPVTGTWTGWLTNTPTLAAPFEGDLGQGYYFQIRARDEVGNVSNWVQTGPITVSSVIKYYAFGSQ
jgi:hypothetical protein